MDRLPVRTELAASKKSHSVFVKNSIAEITKEKYLESRYINTKENLADIPTSGMNSTELKDCSIWWNGPNWLEEDSTCWLTWNVQRIDQEMMEETQSMEIGPRALYEATMITESPDKAHTTLFAIVFLANIS